jgi:DNA invertase Pin-like site-specific DNA recombinase
MSSGSFEEEGKVSGLASESANPTPMRVLGYVRVSTSNQADSGAGLDVQRQAIAAEAERRCWELVHVYEDAGGSGKSMTGRPGLQEALEAVERGEAEALVVAKVDRLSRSLVDFAGIVERARRKGWNLVCLDIGIDLSTPAGEMLAGTLAVFAQFERRLIGQRTKDALAVKRAQGVQLGRPREMSGEAVERIRSLHRSGYRVAEIARILNEERIPTPRGGRWHSPGVCRVLSWSEAA